MIRPTRGRLARWLSAALLGVALATVARAQGPQASVRTSPDVHVSQSNAPLRSVEVPVARRLTLEEDTALKGAFAAQSAAIRGGDFEKGLAATKDLIELLGASIGMDHPITADAQLVGGLLSLRMNDQPTAEQFTRQAFETYARNLGRDNPATFAALDQLDEVLVASGKIDEAVVLTQAALAERRGLAESAPTVVFERRARLLSVLTAARRWQVADAASDDNLKLARDLFANQPAKLSAAVNARGLVHFGMGRNAAAENAFREAVTLAEVGGSSELAGRARRNLAEVLKIAGRGAEAEALQRGELRAREEQSGEGHPAVIRSLITLGESLLVQGRAGEAEAHFRRAETLARSTPRKELVAGALNGLGMSLSAQGRNSEALKAFEEAYPLFEASYGPDHPDTITALSNLGGQHAKMLNHADGESYLRAALGASDRVNGASSYTSAVLANNLSATLANQARYPEAVEAGARALSAFNALLGEGHPGVAQSAENLASAYLEMRRPADAVVAGRAALSARRAIAAREGANADAMQRANLGKQTAFAGWVVAYSAFAGRTVATEAQLMAEAFEAAQLIGVAGAADAIARSAARAAGGEPALADLATRLDQVLEERGKLDREASAAMLSTGSEAEAQRRGLAGKRVELDARVTALEASLRGRFPRYFEFRRAEPVALSGLMARSGADAALLRNDEVLILISEGGRISDRDRPGVIWAVTKERSAWASVGMGSDELRAAVVGMRAELDDPSTKPFSRMRAYRLHEALFGAPEIREIVGSKPNWIIVPQGALLGLPFSALVAATPQGEDTAPLALRATRWLGMERSISIAPSVSSLRALRQFPRAGAGASAFFGVGDPQFSGSGDTRALRGSRFRQGVFGDVAALRLLPALPGTRGEIEAIASALGGGTGDYLLGASATEGAIKARNADGRLARARTIAFATHGLIAGDLGVAQDEPALAFTPPSRPSEDDDGLLTATEAAALRINAEWVVLSACNTASGGAPSADGLTGLARAFFYAGAQSLLVSHWRVRDDAAARLTTSAIVGRTTNRALTRAEALQQSMRALMMDTSLDDGPSSFAHPNAWAPFVVVGVDR